MFLKKFWGADTNQWDLFGRSADIAGDIAIVGAPNHALPDRSHANGAAYIFDMSDPANPVQLSKFTASDNADDGQYDHFTRNLCISGDFAIIAADGDNDNGTNSGSAYIFDISDPERPVEVAKLTAYDGRENDRFSNSVLLDGHIAMAGSSSHDGPAGPDSGAVYVFAELEGLTISPAERTFSIPTTWGLKPRRSASPEARRLPPAVRP